MRYLLFALVHMSAVCCADIVSLHSFQEAEQELSCLTKESLVLFDVDEVLITQSYDFSWGRTRYVLIDPTLPERINSLIDRGVPTMALTACRTRPCGSIPSIEERRIRQLKTLQIDFSRSFPHVSDHAFFDIASDPFRPPLFKEGVLFVGGHVNSSTSRKGIVLGAFLDWLSLKPNRIVFFDDMRSNLLAVQEELKKRDIPFTGYLFEGEISETPDQQVVEASI